MIYIVTNRNPILDTQAPTNFGNEFNIPRGTRSKRAEIRIGWIDPDSGETKILPESENPRSLARNPPSLRLFNHYRATQRSAGKPRNVLFYIHGYNSGFRETVESAKQLEALYGVDVLLFSCPATGDGPREDPYFLERIYGVAGYKCDKLRAKDSSDELLRVFKKMADFFAGISDDRCKQKLSLLAFSMGNYVLKKAVEPSSFSGETSLFDNIILSAPDVNMYDHVNWIHKLKPRGRNFILINERDFPLNFSERKGGAEQKARLGCTIPFETLPDTYYLNLTKCFDIGNCHGYVFQKDWCKEAPVGKCPINQIISPIFNGARPSKSIPGFRSGQQIYSVRKEIQNE